MMEIREPRLAIAAPVLQEIADERREVVLALMAESPDHHVPGRHRGLIPSSSSSAAAAARGDKARSVISSLARFVLKHFQALGQILSSRRSSDSSSSSSSSSSLLASSLTAAARSCSLSWLNPQILLALGNVQRSERPGDRSRPQSHLDRPRGIAGGGGDCDGGFFSPIEI